MNVPDTEKAIHYLSFIGYYRISGYLPPLMANRSRFKPDVIFDDALTYTRNLFAHHSRLWNRTFIIHPRAEYPKVDITQMVLVKDWGGFKAPPC